MYVTSIFTAKEIGCAQITKFRSLCGLRDLYVPHLSLSSTPWTQFKQTNFLSKYQHTEWSEANPGLSLCVRVLRCGRVHAGETAVVETRHAIDADLPPVGGARRGQGRQGAAIQAALPAVRSLLYSLVISLCWIQGFCKARMILSQWKG